MHKHLCAAAVQLRWLAREGISARPAQLLERQGRARAQLLVRQLDSFPFVCSP